MAFPAALLDSRHGHCDTTRVRDTVERSGGRGREQNRSLTIPGAAASYLGVNTTRGTEGVGQASTRSVVLSSMLLILANVLLVRIIFFFYPA